MTAGARSGPASWSPHDANWPTTSAAAAMASGLAESPPPTPVSLADNAGHVLDGDADGAAGGDALIPFDVQAGAAR